MTSLSAVSTSRWDVGRYLAAYCSDRAGDGLFYVALGWLATTATGSLGATAILAAGSVPRVAMLLVGGALGDRWGLLRTTRTTLLLRLLLMAAFAMVALPDRPSGLLLALVAGAFGLVDALHTPALTGLSGVMLRGPAVVRVQGVMGGIGNATEIGAGPLAGLLLIWRSDTVGWIGAGLCVLALVALPRSVESDEPATTHEAQSVRQEVWEVLRTSLRDQQMRTMLAVFAIANFVGTPAIVAGVPLLAALRGWDATAYGLVMAGFAGGSVGGATVLAALGHRLGRPARSAALSLIPAGLLLGAVGTMPNAGLVTVAATGVGVCFAFGAGALMGTIKSVTPPSDMGRMMSLVLVAVYSLIPAGLLCYGAVAQATSAMTAQLVMAVVMTAGGIIAGLSPTLRTVTPSES